MYKVTIRPKSSFITNLSSSTIFGAACWAISDIYGEDVLTDVFNDDASFAVSNAFIHDYIPTGCHKDSKLRNINTNEEILSTFKTFRIDHCQIDRDTNSSAKQWVSHEHFETRDLDVYVSSSMFDMDDIKKIFEVMLTKGLGKSRNKGKGQFGLIAVAEVDLNKLGDENQNGFMVISDYIPNEKDSTIGEYSVRVVNRKTSDGRVCKPVYVIDAGSKFIGTHSGETVGRLQYDAGTGTYLSGRAITIPIHVE